MKTLLFPAPVLLLSGLLLSGCMTMDGWSEAPRGSYDDGYGYDDGSHDGGAPVGWWGSNAGSVNDFYDPLGRYGSWNTHPRYGRVFLPGGIGAGWQPYRDGYWRNDPRYGRRWMSREPFGWATYHYGRWGRDSRLGWFWVPDTRFGGSWVDWRNDRGYASWSPLPPFGWDRYAYGNNWGNDWWIHAPSAYAWRPGLNRHIRPGRPHYDRPHFNGDDYRREQDRREQYRRDRRDDRADGRPVVVRPPRAPIEQVDRHPRSDPARSPDWQRNPAWRGGERQARDGVRPPEWQGGERQPRQGWRGGERAVPGEGRGVRTPRAERPVGGRPVMERAAPAAPQVQQAPPAPPAPRAERAAVRNQPGMGEPRAARAERVQARESRRADPTSRVQDQ